MRGLTDLLITFHIMRGLCGSAPALFGLLFVMAVPVGLLLVLIDQLYLGGLATLAWKLLTAFIRGFH